jgi:hypothetical protein
MHLLQLQQLSAIISLSEKINLMAHKMGLPESDINELRSIENRLTDSSLKQAIIDWQEDLKTLLK